MVSDLVVGKVTMRARYRGVGGIRAHNLFFLSFLIVRLDLRAFTLNHSASLIFVKGFLR
jgi:hypothetical protein